MLDRDIVLPILNQVRTCPHCPSCADLAAHALELLGVEPTPPPGPPGPQIHSCQKAPKDMVGFIPHDGKCPWCGERL